MSDTVTQHYITKAGSYIDDHCTSAMLYRGQAHRWSALRTSAAPLRSQYLLTGTPLLRHLSGSFPSSLPATMRRAIVLCIYSSTQLLLALRVIV